ncbi:AzlC family ABC transporter permease [Sphaerisporangium fuscum]|uniref:AzlC family ABC transporter permease n=1 Tax=Sphaerisporangium fuscum TaxID=2835868 RepID=UPI001BDC7201|nr:AzlC family ABC transporter permease [Sphaerisporangium fuscum]
MRSLLRTLDPPLLRDIGLVCLASAVVGASFGAIAVAGGLPLWVPVVMSLVVFAGGAQFSAVGIVLAGGGPVAAVLAGLVLNARHLPFGFAVADVLGRGRRWSALVGSHVMTDEAVAFTLAQRDPARRRAVFWACGLGLFVLWNLGVLAGGLAGGVLGDTDTYGLDAAFPAALLALVLPTLKDAATRRAALLGAALAVAATPLLPPGLPVLLALAGLVVLGRPKDPGAAAEDERGRREEGEPSVGRAV